MRAYKELKTFDYSKYYNGEIIVGAELNTVLDKVKFELLCYDFDTDKIDDWLEETYVKNEDLDLNKEFNILLEGCKKNNIKIDDLHYERSMGWPVDIVYNSIIKYPENKKYFGDKEWESASLFFRACTCNPDFPLYIDFSFLYPKATEVAKRIRDAGGKVFLAHLYFYPIKNYMEFLDKLRINGIIDGVEVCHSLFNEEQTKTLKEYCKKYNLYMCGGTDCHGDKKPDRKIGTAYGNVCVDEEMIREWHN